MLILSMADKIWKAEIGKAVLLYEVLILFVILQMETSN